MKHIVNFSGGLCSFFAAKRTIQEFGRANTDLLFADTLIESPDLYDFNRRSEDVLGIEINRLCFGLSPWELFRKEGLIGNDHFPICSIRLKREPLNAWMEQHYELDSRQRGMIYGPGTVVLGFDHTEWDRVAKFQGAHPFWTVSAPMTEPPLWDKCMMLREAESLGFKRPVLYELGFPHNNCGGACVKAGISHFVHLYHVLPAIYLQWETEEQLTQQEFKRRGILNWEYTVLKDRRGGETKPLSLYSLRLRIEADEKFPRDEWGGCGCGGIEVEKEAA